MELNDLIGIPWKLNGRTISGTDCLGILYLYYFQFRGIKNKNPGFTNMYKLRTFHKPNKEYLDKILEDFGMKIIKEIVQPEDIVVFNIEDEIHAGIILPFGKFLHSTKSVGSCIDRLKDDYLKALEYGVRVYV